jgi:predicted amino acid dehydrogenase
MSEVNSDSILDMPFYSEEEVVLADGEISSQIARLLDLQDMQREVLHRTGLDRKAYDSLTDIQRQRLETGPFASAVIRRHVSRQECLQTWIVYGLPPDSVNCPDNDRW